MSFESDKKLLAKHLEGLAGTPDCVVCKANDWIFLGVPEIELRTHSPALRESLPLAMIACEQCSHVIHFAWNRIKRPSDG